MADKLGEAGPKTGNQIGRRRELEPLWLSSNCFGPECKAFVWFLCPFGMEMPRECSGHDVIGRNPGDLPNLDAKMSPLHQEPVWVAIYLPE